MTTPHSPREELRFYTVVEAGKILKLARATVYRRIASGELTYADIGDGKPKLRITNEDIRRYNERRRRNHLRGKRNTAA